MTARIIKVYNLFYYIILLFIIPLAFISSFPFRPKIFVLAVEIDFMLRQF
jgi:ABC-type uncharacterized transport system permease subunit